MQPHQHPGEPKHHQKVSIQKIKYLLWLNTQISLSRGHWFSLFTFSALSRRVLEPALPRKAALKHKPPQGTGLDTSTKPTLAANHFPAGANLKSIFPHSSWLMSTFPQRGCVGLCSIFREDIYSLRGKEEVIQKHHWILSASFPPFHIPKAVETEWQCCVTCQRETAQSFPLQQFYFFIATPTNLVDSIPDSATKTEQPVFLSCGSACYPLTKNFKARLQW